MTQDERLTYLVERFKEDSGRFRNLDAGSSREEKRRVLRSLMNIRLPGEMDAETLRVQDDYLTEAAREKGIVTLEEIPTVRERYGGANPFADRLSLWQGDITRLAVGAIVNAANSQMLGCFIPCHACIDNCIHTYAGIQLRSECARQMELCRRRYGQNYQQPTAIPMLTDAYNLPANHVVHIVGPIVEGDLTRKLQRELAECYQNTLDICAENDIESVAFCCISTGVFHFPKERAAEIAVKSVTEWLYNHEGRMNRVIFNVFGDDDRRYYERRLILNCLTL